MKIANKILFFLLVVICMKALSLQTFATEEYNIEVSNNLEFNNAIERINNTSEGSFIIKLTSDIEINTITIDSPCEVTIIGNDHDLVLAQNSSIHVAKGSKLNLGLENENSTLTIKGDGTNSDVPGLLYIEGTCNMYNGVTLKDREGSNYFGGGVTVHAGKFHMYGGTIENCGISGGSVCYGGGIAVVYGGSFIMDDGKIQNCYATSDHLDDYDPNRCFTAIGGGVFVSGGSSFVMNGGTISNNTSTNMGGGIAIMSSCEEVSSGFGNLDSSVEIYGGTIENNSSENGAGIFASAYYYAYASGICSSTPTISESEKQGLYISNAKILQNNANEEYGLGGGLFVVMLKSPAIVNISNTSFKNNTASIGGAIMSYGYWTNMNIDKSTITSNNAKSYGGGFATQSNTSGGKTTITNTVLCNNIADKAASDVYVNNSNLALQSALDMNSIYLGEPSDVYNEKIDGWYVDNEDSRYSTQTKDERTEYQDYTNIEEGKKVCLISAARPSLAKVTFANEDGTEIYKEDWYKFGTDAKDIELPTATKESDDTYDYVFDSWSPEVKDVTENTVYTANFKKMYKSIKAKYEFSSSTQDTSLPSEVMALLPSDETSYPRDNDITAIIPSKTEVEVDGGKWTFKGFDKDTITASMENADDNGNVKFVGYWEYTENTNEPIVNENNNDSPKTGDESHIFLWTVILLVSSITSIKAIKYNKNV